MSELKQWQSDLENTVASLVIHANSSLVDAMSCYGSDANAFFKSNAFDGYKKERENQGKLFVSIANSINNVIKGINVLIKKR